MMTKIAIPWRITLPDGTREVITNDMLDEYSLLYRLPSIAPNRYSSLFLMQMMTLERLQGIDPLLILAEIKALEGIGPHTGTKPATKFRKPPLNGLWHKHFVVNLPGSLAHNILQNLGGNGLKRITEEIFDPAKHDVVTREMIDALVFNVVEKQLSDRADKGRLTGEWIVFTKHQDQNYYLSICSHAHGDHQIANNIRLCCNAEFPFLDGLLGPANQAST